MAPAWIPAGKEGKLGAFFCRYFACCVRAWSVLGVTLPLVCVSLPLGAHRQPCFEASIGLATMLNFTGFPIGFDEIRGSGGLFQFELGQFGPHEYPEPCLHLCRSGEIKLQA